MVNTKVNLAGQPLDNPIIPTSGTFGYIFIAFDFKK